MLVCLIFAFLWGLAAGTVPAMPERIQWPMAWALIGTGIPLLGFMTIQAGPVFGLGGLVVAALLVSRVAGRSGNPSTGEV